MPCLFPLDLHISYLQSQEPLSVCKAMKCCPFSFHICYLLHQVGHTRTHHTHTHTHKHTQACLAGHTHTHTHTLARTHAHTHTRTHHTHTHTHTNTHRPAQHTTICTEVK